MNDKIETADKYTVIHSGQSRGIEVLENLGVIGESISYYVDIQLILSKSGHEMVCISMKNKANNKRCKYISLFPDQVMELRKILNSLVIKER